MEKRYDLEREGLNAQPIGAPWQPFYQNMYSKEAKAYERRLARGKRVCAHKDCSTVLSIYNDEDLCTVHDPEMSYEIGR